MKFFKSAIIVGSLVSGLSAFADSDISLVDKEIHHGYEMYGYKISFDKLNENGVQILKPSTELKKTMMKLSFTAKRLVVPPTAKGRFGNLNAKNDSFSFTYNTFESDARGCHAEVQVSLGHTPMIGIFAEPIGPSKEEEEACKRLIPSLKNDLAAVGGQIAISGAFNRTYAEEFFVDKSILDAKREAEAITEESNEVTESSSKVQQN